MPFFEEDIPWSQYFSDAADIARARRQNADRIRTKREDARKRRPNPEFTAKKPNEATLLKLADGRVFFAKPDMAALLIEFAKTFAAEVYVVRIVGAETLSSLDDLVAHINSGTGGFSAGHWAGIKEKYVTIRVVVGPAAPPAIPSKKIRDFITTKIADASAVTMTDLAAQFPTVDQKRLTHFMALAAKRMTAGGLNASLHNEELKVVPANVPPAPEAIQPTA